MKMRRLDVSVFDADSGCKSSEDEEPQMGFLARRFVFWLEPQIEIIESAVARASIWIAIRMLVKFNAQIGRFVLARYS